MTIPTDPTDGRPVRLGWFPTTTALSLATTPRAVDGRRVRGWIDGRVVAAVADYDLSPAQRGEFEALAAAARRNVLAEAGRLKSAATIPCLRCAGSGIFATRYENGKPAGRTGICYRCNGKGRQTGADQARNHVYDALYFAARR